jgi:hypothetical protein
MDPAYEKQELSINVPGTGFKLTAMDPAYLARVVQGVQLDVTIAEDKE